MRKTERLHLTAIFSEDIRPESNGQSTIVGWFTSGHINMNGATPFVMPKFCITGLLEIPIERKLKSIKLEIKLSDAVLSSIEMPQQAFSDLEDDLSLPEPDGPNGVQITLNIQMGNFLVPSEGTLRLIAICDDEEVLSNGLKFSNREPPTKRQGRLRT